MIGVFGRNVHIVTSRDRIAVVNDGGDTQQMVDLFRPAAPVRCGVNEHAVDDTARTPNSAPSTTRPHTRHDPTTKPSVRTRNSTMF
jgi:hypothetical protein